MFWKFSMHTIGPTPFNVKALRRFLALSNHPLSRAARRARAGVLDFELPAPKVIVWPMLCGFLAARGCVLFLKKKLICEPCLKAYCTSYGRRLRTGVFFPWIEGSGEIHLGDGVFFHGKFSISFALRFSERPSLTIGDNTGFGHEVIARRRQEHHDRAQLPDLVEDDDRRLGWAPGGSPAATGGPAAPARGGAAGDDRGQRLDRHRQHHPPGRHHRRGERHLRRLRRAAERPARTASSWATRRRSWPRCRARNPAKARSRRHPPGRTAP